MKFRLSVIHAAAGAMFRLSGKRRPDSYIFSRRADASHIHSLEVPAANMVEVCKDLELRSRYSEATLTIEPLFEDADFEGNEVIAKRDATIAEKEAEIAKLKEANGKLQEACNALQVQLADKPSVGLTPDQIEALEERDALLETLRPYVQNDEETPLDVLKRVLQGEPEEEKPAKKKGKKAKNDNGSADTAE